MIVMARQPLQGLAAMSTAPPAPPISSLPNRFDPEALGALFLARAHPGWLGLKYSAHGTNWVELELPWSEKLLGEPDRLVLASGPIISLMDMASGMAIWQTHTTFLPVATLDLRVDYQRAARERSAVWGRVECYRITRSAAFVRGIAHDGDPDDTVATMAGVFMTLGADPRQSRMASPSEAGTGDA